MTVIDTTFTDAEPESEFSRRQRLQQEAAAARMMQRHDNRVANEKTLEGPDGMVKANEPLRIARRVQRVETYRDQSEPASRAHETLTDAARAADVLTADARNTEEQLEKIVGNADFLSVRYLDDGVAAARSVGRVNVRSADGSGGYGTGFLVSKRLLLTNHHVLPDADTAQRSFVEFNYQDGPGGFPLQTTTLRFAPSTFFIANKELDFALVAVDAQPDQLAVFGFNCLTAAQGTVLIGEPVTIVQHPRGERKQIVLRENKLIDIPEYNLHYSADTEPGSSGSPVFNDQWEVIALHHASVPTPTSEQYPFLNEGIRISRILQALAAAQLPPAMRAIAVEDFAELVQTSGGTRVQPSPPLEVVPTTPNKPAEPAVPSQTAEPVEVTVRFNDSVVHAVGTIEHTEPATEAVQIDPDYSTRSGYDSQFLGVALALPEPTAAIADDLSPELKYHHFSIRMHKPRRLAAFTAVNIRGPIDRINRETDRWVFDPRVPSDQQTGEQVYKNNPLDRGHLVRRLDPAWGPNAKAAVDDTFHFTNCTPQHHDFNAGSKLWLGLEDYILNNTDNQRLAVSVFSGPVLATDDPPYRGVELPKQYWKIAAMVKTDGQLSVTGYLLSQTALLDDVTGTEEFTFGAYRTFQVPVRRIAGLTGLELDAFITGDPLERLEATALPRELLREQDIIL